MDTSERAVVKREPQRRRWPEGEKCRIVEQTLKPGASVARVALAHGVNANQAFSWRRQYRQGLLSQRNAGGLRAVVPISDRTRLPFAVSGQRLVLNRRLSLCPASFETYHSGASRACAPSPSRIKRQTFQATRRRNPPCSPPRSTQRCLYPSPHLKYRGPTVARQH
jgi:transposase-like protein